LARSKDSQSVAIRTAVAHLNRLDNTGFDNGYAAGFEAAERIKNMKHETEINYVKNKIQKLEADFAGFASLLIESGIVEVEEQNGELRYKVNKVKLEEASDGKEKE